ncbi:hypothetical protein B9Z19DRAFT_1119426 [Tuber borchii]|uniref:Uncharacterized protein n=1 Tax=Tuber borchii TaxID=42251 RepID=A0A2T7A6M1_TUBBO|nr:hypothetical protein B9Z19DRAFT_1119426 [Tuber borchii]
MSSPLCSAALTPSHMATFCATNTSSSIPMSLERSPNSAVLNLVSAPEADFSSLVRPPAPGSLKYLQRYPWGIFPLTTKGQPETAHESAGGLTLVESDKAFRKMKEELRVCRIT